MARVNPAVLNQIYKAAASGSSPIAAFMVGRDQKYQRQRQEILDEQNATSQALVDDLRTEQIKQIRDEPARLAAEQAEAQRKFSLKKGQSMRALVEADIPSNVKQALVGQLQAAQTDNDIASVLDEFNQQFGGIQKIEQGAPGDFTPTASQGGAAQIKLDEQLTALNSFGAMGQRLLDVAFKTPGANTLTGQLTNIGNRLNAEVETLASQLGVEFESGNDAFNPERYNDVFESTGLAGASARVKSGFVGLAIQKAIASGQGAGKALSDNDIRLQLMTVGQNQGDPNILQALLSDGFLNLEDSYGFRADATPGLRKGEVVRPDFVNAGPATGPVREAPPAALQHLKENPNLIDEFEKKYGYRPEGF